MSWVLWSSAHKDVVKIYYSKEWQAQVIDVKSHTMCSQVAALMLDCLVYRIIGLSKEERRAGLHQKVNSDLRNN